MSIIHLPWYKILLFILNSGIAYGGGRDREKMEAIKWSPHAKEFKNMGTIIAVRTFITWTLLLLMVFLP